MAAPAHCKDLCGAMDDLSIDNDVRLKQLGLNENLRSKLKEILNSYDSIFSWDIKQLTGSSQNLMANLVDKMHEKCEMILHKDDEFNLNKFYLKLIIVYEHYMCGSYDESLKEIENVVEFLKSCKYDESNEQYSDAFNHIAQTTNAYVASTLNRNSDNIMKNIKPTNCLNRAEKAAICAVKARVFMEYPPKGNDIALILADEACNLHSTEPEWIIIWLKAKGRVRRYYEQFGMPDEVEIDAAEMLCSTKTKPRLLIQASKLFMEVAYCHKLKFNQNESNKYYKLSSELTLKALELAKDDIKQLYSCLLTFIDYPKHLQPKTVIDDVIQKLSNVKNSRVDQVLGKYYLKHKKDYEKAKIHLSRAMVHGHFGTSLQLIKVECLLQPVEKFPLVQTLNMIYDVFTNPKRRLIILSQILIYYNYYENNPREMMHYLKLYMDQEIDDTFKKRHLIFAHPLFKVNHFKMKQFLNVLSLKLKNIEDSDKWSSQEKKIINDTVERFNKMSKIKMYENQYFNDNKTGAHNQNFDNKSNKYYINKKPYNVKHNEWQKRSNIRQSCSSTSIDQNDVHEKCSTSNKKSSYHKLKTKHDLIKPLQNSLNEISEPMLSLNDSNNIDSKLKKFECKHNSLDNIHVVSMESSSARTSSDFRTRGRGGMNYYLQNRQNRFQNQGKFLHTNDNYDFQHAQGRQKWRAPRQNNSNNDQKLKNSDTNGNRKPFEQNIDSTESQLPGTFPHSKLK